MVVERTRVIPASDSSAAPLRVTRSGASRLLFVIAPALLLAGLSACDRGPSDVREWTPNDHDQPASAPGQVSARQAGEGPDPTLIDLAWKRNCATCHGPMGHGDGPQGPMVRAPDLTRADWQQNISDDEMAAIIRKGKNKMPAFDLPDQVTQGLVQRIRAARGK